MLYKFRFGAGPVSNSIIEDIQKRFSLEFPKDYVDFIIKINGGTPLNPCFYSIDLETGEKLMRRLLFIGSVTTQPSLWSLVTSNEQFHSTESNMNNHWIIGAVEDAGNLIMDCRSGQIGICDLGANYGLPTGGLKDIAAASFADFIANLTADESGTWFVIDWANPPKSWPPT